jgi:hypothetical protein
MVLRLLSRLPTKRKAREIRLSPGIYRKVMQLLLPIMQNLPPIHAHEVPVTGPPNADQPPDLGGAPKLTGGSFSELLTL